MCLIENFISNVKINFMKKIKLLFLIMMMFVNSTTVFATYVENHNATIAKSFRNYICMQQRGRAILYNTLGLSDAQILEREVIAAQFVSLYELMFEQLYKEAQRLDLFEKTGYTGFQIYCQKRLLGKYRKNIMLLLAKENRLFAKCLTKEQYRKYKEVEALNKHEYKQLTKQKDYYKSNPKMKAFGNPKPSPTPISSAE